MVKRFIAGARCPACGLEDTVYVVGGVNGAAESGAADTRHCVACGFSDERPDIIAEPDAGDWQTVKISVDAGTKKRFENGAAKAAKKDPKK